MNTKHAQRDFLRAVYRADTKQAVEALNRGVDVDTADPATGLTALHIAVGTNNLTLTRILVEDWNAAFKPDALGRWPTLIAAKAQVDDAMCDYIVEAEANAYYASLKPA